VTKQEEDVKNESSSEKTFLAIFKESENSKSSNDAGKNTDSEISKSSDADLRDAFTVTLPSNKSLKCVKVKEVI